METKLFEIRDEGTHIPALAVRLNSETEEEQYVLRRAGFGPSAAEHGTFVVLMSLNEIHRCEYSPCGWTGPRTMPQAHLFIVENWHKMKSGDVVDVQFVLGETTEPKKSERFNQTTTDRQGSPT